jgi:exonuclease III
VIGNGVYSDFNKNCSVARGRCDFNLSFVATESNQCKCCDNYIKLVNVNTRSVRQKTSILVDYIVSNKIDLCCICETWLTPVDDVHRSELKPQGYNFLDVPRQSGRIGGGTGIMYRDNIKVSPLGSEEKSSFEASAWKVTVSKTCDIIIHVVYRPPYSANHKVTTNTFYDEFQDYLSEALQSDVPVIFTGDYNIRMNVDNDSDKYKFGEILTMFSLTQHVKVPTHQAGNTLDLIITRDSDNICLDSPKADFLISDHMAIITTLRIQRPPVQFKELQTRHFNAINSADFINDITCFVNRCVNIHDIDDLAVEYNNSLRQIMDKHAPVVRKRVAIRPKVPWYGKKINDLKRVKRKCEKIWRSDRNELNLKKFHEARNAYVNELNTQRLNCIKNAIIEAKGNKKKVSRLVNNLLNRNKSNPVHDDTSAAEFANCLGQ